MLPTESAEPAEGEAVTLNTVAVGDNPQSLPAVWADVPVAREAAEELAEVEELSPRLLASAAAPADAWFSLLGAVTTDELDDRQSTHDLAHALSTPSAKFEELSDLLFAEDELLAAH